LYSFGTVLKSVLKLTTIKKLSFFAQPLDQIVKQPSYKISYTGKYI